VNSHRRGTCPGILDPIPTGDGLLARLLPTGPLPIDTLVALCDYAQAYGNGIVEVTQRGSLQFRGLSPASAPDFARTVIALGLGAESGPPILASPLMGLDAQECFDLCALLAALRAELTNQPAVASIGPKVSVLIDGGGALHLDSVPGDLRLQAGANSRLHVSIAGTAATSTSLGWVLLDHAVKVIVHLLARIADRGTNARARDFANPADVQALRASLSSMLNDARPPTLRPPAEPIGLHPLNTGQLALGVALAFGYTEAAVLKRLAQRAAACDAKSIQTSPGRSLLIIGLDADAASELAAAAAAAGFLVRPDDPRRFVVACAGAPACESAKLSTRELAPVIAEAARPFLDGSLTIHVSGCAKGCAHPGAAALTFIGPNRLVVQGRAGDTPHGTTSVDNFIAGVSRLGVERQQSHNARDRSVDVVSRLGATGVLAAMSTGT
jgi:precorrin-3B synthase